MMNLNERQTKILDYILQNGDASVEELAIIFDVSKMTIRRDLEKLHNDNLLTRTHGGAMVNRNMLITEIHYNKKRDINKDIKSEIAKIAYEYIEGNQAIFLDAGTTTYELAQLLFSYNNLTIFTNDLMIASLLYSSNNELVFVGGNVKKETGNCVGKYATAMIEELNIDIAFLAASTVSSDLYVCTPDITKQEVKQAMINSSYKKILLVDSNKFHQSALYKVASLKLFDVIITDYEFLEEHINYLLRVEIRNAQLQTNCNKTKI